MKLQTSKENIAGWVNRDKPVYIWVGFPDEKQYILGSYVSPDIPFYLFITWYPLLFIYSLVLVTYIALQQRYLE